jgi:diguanylate cyclase (GGDEF)-like protein/hemerythrin-like metal-binding protein
MGAAITATISSDPSPSRLDFDSQVPILDVPSPPDQEGDPFISELRRRLEFLKHHDPTTRLLHCARVIDHAVAAVASAHLRKDRVALLLVDVDNFAKFGESLYARDGVPSIVSQCISYALTPEDFIGHLSGNQFLVVLRHGRQLSAAALAAGRVLRALLRLHGERIEVSASVGISTYPQDGDTLHDLLASAKTALHDAKSMGRGRFSLAPASRKIALMIGKLVLHDEDRIGIPEVDVEHRSLVERMNALACAVQDNAPAAQLRAGLEDLMLLLASHAVAECEAMLRHPSPEDAAHRADHVRVLHDLEILTIGQGRDGLAIAARFAYEWFCDHIRTFDRALALRARRKRQLPINDPSGLRRAS